LSWRNVSKDIWRWGTTDLLEGRRVLYHVDKLAVVDLPAIPLIYVDGGDECMANTVLSLEPPYALSPPLVA